MLRPRRQEARPIYQDHRGREGVVAKAVEVGGQRVHRAFVHDSHSHSSFLWLQTSRYLYTIDGLMIDAWCITI